MRKARLFAGAFLVALAGCQWVLPLREGGGAGDAGGSLDANGQPESGQESGAEASGVESGGGDASSGDAMQCNTAYTGDPPCDACLNQMCCASFTQCFVVNPECAALEMCILACNPLDFSCPTNCANMHPSGVNDYARADTCSKACNSACGVPTDSGSDAAVAGDLCNPAMGPKCAGGVLDCVPPPSPFQGTCRLPCQSFADCANNGLINNACCFLGTPAINVCIPNTDVPDGSSCN